MRTTKLLTNIKLARWKLRKEIMKIVIISLVAGSRPTRPTMPLMIKSIWDILKRDCNLAVEEKKIKRVLKSLEKKEILSLIEMGEEVIVQTVNEDHPVVIKHSIRALLDFKKKTKEWKGKWYMVFFDVPEIQRNKRDYLRRFLTKLGFYPYQKSVYIFPYECEKEISLIKKVIESAKYIKYIIAEKIEDEDLIKQFFQL